MAGESIRDGFVAEFGEDEALRLEAAANGHESPKNKGSDPFKWVLVICIGYQCMELDKYRQHHGIKASWENLRQWIIDNAKLGTHDGDYDPVTALSGGYNEFVKDYTTEHDQT